MATFNSTAGCICEFTVSKLYTKVYVHTTLYLFVKKMLVPMRIRDVEVHPAERKYTDLRLWDFIYLEINSEANNLTKFKIIAQV